jgi:hypothetical protein
MSVEPLPTETLSECSPVPKLTRRQAAIITAFTGIACGPFGDCHEYVDSLPGFKGIGTISFAQTAVWEQIKRACQKDFIAICAGEDDPL